MKNKLSFLLLLVWVFIPSMLLSQNKNSVEGDREALMDIYHAMGGPNWYNNSGWGGSAASMGSWFGVTTNSQGRVTHLDLQTGTPFSNNVPDNQLHRKGNNLRNANSSGDLIPGREFPESIGNLKELRYLNVKSNTIRGPIPKSITLLTKVERILLEGHWREPDPGSGSNVPYNHPVASANGKTSAGTNFWTGSIPENVGNLKNLVVWESQQTALTGSIPKQFGQLQNLEMLLLNGIYQNRDNSLKMSGPIPPELGNAKKLRYLYLSDQNFSGTIPPELGKLTDLKQLRLEHWPLTSGGLTGQIPKELGNIPDIRMIILPGNQLTGGFPTFLFHGTTALHTLRLEYNNFSGALPATLNPASNMNVLSISQNNFSGEIPNWVTSRGLIQMNFDNNNFSGNLPPGFHDQNARIWNYSNGGRLRNMNLHNNELTGPLPSVIIGKDIWNMRLNDNNFTESIPNEWGEINTRRDLRIWINNNNLSGYVNPNVAKINNLSLLHIQGNNFSQSDLNNLVKAMPGGVNFSYGNQDPGGAPAPAPQDPPATPSLSNPSNNTTGVSVTPTLSWGSVTGASSYRLQVSRDGFTNYAVDLNGFTGTSHKVSADLDFDTQYSWRVRASNQYGNSSWSSVRAFTTEKPEQQGDTGGPDDEGGSDSQHPAVLPSPSRLSPAHQETGVSLKPEIKWSDVGADYYILHSNRLDPTEMVLEEIVHGTAFIPIDELDPEALHHWRVRGVKDGVEGDWSSIGHFTTGKTPEEHGDGDEEGDDGQGSGGDENEDGDKPGPKEDDESGNSGSDDGKADDENSDGDTGKEDEEGEGDSGEEDEEGGDKPGEKEEEVEEEEIVEEKPRGNSNPNERATMRQNYPNPFNPSTQIQFSVNQPQQVSLRVYNMAGRLVGTLFEGAVAPGSHQATFSADNLASGIYFYRLITEHEVITRQMTFLK